MRSSLTALVTAGIAALSLVTGAAAASAAPQSTASPQTSTTFVFDQVATSEPAGQYIQIKNINSMPQDLSNFRVDATPWPSLPAIVPIATIPPNTILQPRQVYLITEFDPGAPPLTARFGICLVSPSNNVVDAMATFPNPNSPCLRGNPAPLLPTNQPLALVRYSNTDNNATDFHIAPRTPGLPGPDA
jgi:hypothetical protein